ncbi:MAG: hypothetical protein IT304_01045 [Dehalococcoidia bacterium]|nr:hypothetical protein [Dehalococcoidia bacterium]
MEEPKRSRPLLGRPLLGLIAALALMLGVGGAIVVAGDSASAQTATTTSTARASVTAPSTGSGLSSNGGDSSLVAPLAILGVIVLGGGAAFAIASRKNG